WNFPEGRHLALTRLVQNLPDLCILFRPILRRLSRGQKAKNASRESRIHPQHLQRRNNTVPSERDAEPGYTGIGIESLRRLRDQHVKIGERPVQPVIELLIRSVDMDIGSFGFL